MIKGKRLDTKRRNVAIEANRSLPQITLAHLVAASVGSTAQRKRKQLNMLSTLDRIEYDAGIAFHRDDVHYHDAKSVNQSLQIAYGHQIVTFLSWIFSCANVGENSR